MLEGLLAFVVAPFVARKAAAVPEVKRELTARELGDQRLLALADILEANTGYYNQGHYFNWASADGDIAGPSCALGHWWFHNQDRWEPRIHHVEFAGHTYAMGGSPGLRGTSLQGCTAAMQEFDLDTDGVHKLFGVGGCDEAGGDSKHAAAYIRYFVAQRNVQGAREAA